MTVYRKDNPEYVKIGLDSMLNQTVKTDDFVLVCDGELTEDLNRMIGEYVIHEKSVFNVIRLPENVGLGAALKTGIRYCKNELVARMDDDDISHPDRCEVELAYMLKNPDVSIVGSYVNEFENDPKVPMRLKKVPIGSRAIRLFARRRNPFNHSSVMFRKSHIISAGNYSEMRTNQDVELWVRMLNSGYIGANLDMPLVDFRFDRETYKRRKEWRNIKLMIELWREFWKQGHCSFLDFSYVGFVQLSIYIMPGKLLSWVYDHVR